MKFFSGLAIFLFSVQSALAASFYFSPAAGSYDVGETFRTSVYVSTDREINGVAGNINVGENLEIVGVAKGGVVNFWLREPSFGGGQIGFEGVILNPGFVGKSGKVLDLTLKAKTAGDGAVRFTSGAIYANDGQGTNIYGGSGSADFKVLAAVVLPPIVLEEVQPQVEDSALIQPSEKEMPEVVKKPEPQPVILNRPRIIEEAAPLVVEPEVVVEAVESVVVEEKPFGFQEGILLAIAVILLILAYQVYRLRKEIIDKR